MQVTINKANDTEAAAGYQLMVIVNADRYGREVYAEVWHVGAAGRVRIGLTSTGKFADPIEAEARQIIIDDMARVAAEQAASQPAEVAPAVAEVAELAPVAMIDGAPAMVSADEARSKGGRIYVRIDFIPEGAGWKMKMSKRITHASGSGAEIKGGAEDHKAAARMMLALMRDWRARATAAGWVKADELDAGGAWIAPSQGAEVAPVLAEAANESSSLIARLTRAVASTAPSAEGAEILSWLDASGGDAAAEALESAEDEADAFGAEPPMSEVDRGFANARQDERAAMAEAEARWAAEDAERASHGACRHDLGICEIAERQQAAEDVDRWYAENPPACEVCRASIPSWNRDGDSLCPDCSAAFVGTPINIALAMDWADVAAALGAHATHAQIAAALVAYQHGALYLDLIAPVPASEAACPECNGIGIINTGRNLSFGGLAFYGCESCSGTGRKLATSAAPAPSQPEPAAPEGAPPGAVFSSSWHTSTAGTPSAVNAPTEATITNATGGESSARIMFRRQDSGYVVIHHATARNKAGRRKARQTGADVAELAALAGALIGGWQKAAEASGWTSKIDGLDLVWFPPAAPEVAEAEAPAQFDADDVAPLDPMDCPACYQAIQSHIDGGPADHACPAHPPARWLAAWDELSMRERESLGDQLFESDAHYDRWLAHCRADAEAPALPEPAAPCHDDCGAEAETACQLCGLEVCMACYGKRGGGCNCPGSGGNPEGGDDPEPGTPGYQDAWARASDSMIESAARAFGLRGTPVALAIPAPAPAPAPAPEPACLICAAPARWESSTFAYNGGQFTICYPCYDNKLIPLAHDCGFAFPLPTPVVWTLADDLRIGAERKARLDALAAEVAQRRARLEAAAAELAPLGLALAPTVNAPGGRYAMTHAAGMVFAIPLAAAAELVKANAEHEDAERRRLALAGDASAASGLSPEDAAELAYADQRWADHQASMAGVPRIDPEVSDYADIDYTCPYCLGLRGGSAFCDCGQDEDAGPSQLDRLGGIADEAATLLPLALAGDAEAGRQLGTLLAEGWRIINSLGLDALGDAPEPAAPALPAWLQDDKSHIVLKGVTGCTCAACSAARAAASSAAPAEDTRARCKDCRRPYGGPGDLCDCLPF